MSSIDNLDEFLSKEEQFPKLYKWFDEGFEEEQKKGGYAHKKKQSDKVAEHVTSSFVASPSPKSNLYSALPSKVRPPKFSENLIPNLLF